jgi:hypothetical protein
MLAAIAARAASGCETVFRSDVADDDAQKTLSYA